MIIIKKNKCLFIFLLLTLALMSIVSATDTNDTTHITGEVSQDVMLETQEITQETSGTTILDDNSNVIKENNEDKQAIQNITKKDKTDEKVKTESNGDNVTVVNVTSSNFKQYFTVMSNVAYMGKGITSTNNTLILNVKYVPNNVYTFSLDENSNKFQNLSLVIDGQGCNALTNVGFRLSTNFKTVVLQNFNSTITESYTKSDYLTLTGTNGTYIIRNMTIDVQKPDLTTYVFRVEKESLIENCNLKACLSECTINWDAYPYLPDCIGFYVKTQAEIRNNNIEILITGNNGGSYYSSFAAFLGTSGITFVNNTIISTNCTDDSGYSYGLVVRSSNNIIKDNKIYITSHTYTAGIHLEMATFKNNIIEGNYINVTSSYGNAPWGNIAVAYAINMLDFQYTGNLFGVGGNHPNNNSIIRNILVGEAAQIYGVEMFGGYNNNISENNITLYGRTCMGIGIIGANITSNNNNIVVIGEHNQTEGTADYLKAKTTGLYSYLSDTGIEFKNNTIYSENAPGIILEKVSNVVVQNNSIYSEGHDYTVEVDGNNNIVTDNILEARNNMGDSSVSGQINNTVENNTYYFEPNITVDFPERIITNTEVPILISLNDDEEKPVTNKKIYVQINNQNIIEELTTDTEGNCIYYYTATESGTKTLTITSPKENNILESVYITDFNVEKLNTNITINSINQTKYYDNITITGTLKDTDNQPITDDIQITFNNEEITLTTDSEGLYSFTTIAKNIGTNNITASYNGNTKYNPTSTTTTFTVIGKQPVIVTYEPISDVNFGENVTITGKFMTSNGKAISNSNVKIYINGVKYLAKTDKTGTYALSVQTTQTGVNKVSIGYSGNDKYEAYETNTTFQVLGKQPVIVTYEPINDVNYGENITITGKFMTTNGKAITNSNVKIYINGVKYLAKTDKTGTYTLSVATTQTGTNKVSIGYSGNDKYEAYETNTTFQVLGKQPVIVTYEPISNVNYGENVTITGKFMTSNGKTISNSNVKIYINGVKYLAKTDKTGTYTLSVATTQTGTNKVSIGYSGNDKYEAYETNTTFQVLGKQPVTVTYEPINNVKQGQNVIITGKFTTNTGKAITNTNVKIYINGKKYYAKTDNTGKYTLSTQANTLGINNVTIGYSGNDKYEAYETNTTFTVTA
ncbi:MAG: Ig-like domain repeat protein [Methanosphaera sp.]|nr:Ig-like domain repeat protein [Methanosphaera sp.]